MDNLKHAINLSLFLFAIWLLLSGHYTPLLLALGLASVLFTVVLAYRVDLVDKELHPLLLKPTALLYWLWLLGQIVKSSVEVTRIILHPRLPISPRVLRVRASQHTDLGRVTYANSITLVPGTVSMDLQNDTVLVHALTRAAALDLERGEMDRRVCDMERGF